MILALCQSLTVLCISSLDAKQNKTEIKYLEENKTSYCPTATHLQTHRYRQLRAYVLVYACAWNHRLKKKKKKKKKK